MMMQSLKKSLRHYQHVFGKGTNGGKAVSLVYRSYAALGNVMAPRAEGPRFQGIMDAAPRTDRFRKTQGQVMAEASAALQRALRNL
jgi:hypothetical protein